MRGCDLGLSAQAYFTYAFALVMLCPLFTRVILALYIVIVIVMVMTMVMGSALNSLELP